MTGAVRAGTPAGRWILTATVLGSGMAFLDGTIVNVALPSIADDLGAGLTELQWILDGYLVTLTALLLLGGALGDRLGRRRVFRFGLVAFTIASLACGAAPTVTTLLVARAIQGVGAALLVPGSLAIISASFAPEDRGRAIGAWSGLAGVASAIGPFVGGYLIDAASWRTAFLLNVPLAAVAWLAAAHVPESSDDRAGAVDVAGAVTITVGLACGAWALIEGPAGHASEAWVVGAVGVASLLLFAVVEKRSAAPMLPLELFRSRQFTGANLTTLAVYAGLSGAFFLFVLQLQLVLGYSALEAGGALLPVTVVMVLLSARVGALAQRIGPRLPMSIGPLVVGAGLLLLARVDAGDAWLGSVLPAALVFGLGLATTVAPLTSAVLAAADDRHVGAASGVNNAVARLAGLLAVAVLPGVAGVDTAAAPAVLDTAVDRAMVGSAALAALGGVIAFLTVRDGRATSTPTVPTHHPCHDPCVAIDEMASTEPRTR